MPVTTQAFKGWLKSSNNMNLSSDSSLLRLTQEGMTNFACISDFDKKSIDNLPSVYKNRIPAIESDASKTLDLKLPFPDQACPLRLAGSLQLLMLPNITALLHGLCVPKV